MCGSTQPVRGEAAHLRPLLAALAAVLAVAASATLPGSRAAGKTGHDESLSALTDVAEPQVLLADTVAATPPRHNERQPPMRRTLSANFFAAAAGGLLLLTPGCAGPADQPGSIQDQKQAGGCDTANQKDPFVLSPATKPESFDPLLENGKLPPAIQVDTNRNKLLATRIGVGVQVYDHDSANSRWAFREPQANLYDIETGVQHGLHFAGPYWTDSDGSRVKAKASGEADAPIDSERNIKWLRLETAERFGSNNDVFGQVTFIQRVRTDGGQPPSTWEPAKGCDTVSVPYTALYIFWGQKEQ